MPFRITEASTSAQVAAQIATSRQRIATAQEQIASGKRINRPSDDPAGAAVVVRIRTTQAVLGQIERNVEATQNTLLTSDSVLESYEQAIDHARVLLTQGASDTTTQNGRQSIATEIDSLRTHILELANQRYGDQYLFGGTRQEAPPYDTNGVPAATPAARQVIQIEPSGETLAVGVTAESAFADATGTIFEPLSDAAAALRGTGDAAADRAAILESLNRLGDLANKAREARTYIGVGIDRTQGLAEDLHLRSLSLEETAQRTEGVDFVESAIRLTDSQRTLDAILQTKAVTRRTSLIDLLG